VKSLADEPTIRTLSRWKRPVAPSQFWLVTALAILFLLIPLGILLRIEMATPAIGQETSPDLALKRQALDRARALCNQGQYDQCIGKLDAYLRKYPQSVVARNERNRAASVVHHTTATTVPVAERDRPSSRPQHRNHGQDNETEANTPASDHPSLLERVKRFFHRH
jgi:hypothetical protein